MRPTRWRSRSSMPTIGKVPRSRPRWRAEHAVEPPCARLEWGATFPGFAIMDLTALIVFATALVVAAASPGPGIIAIVACVVGRGPHGAVDRTGGTMLAGAAVAVAAK